MFSKMKRRQKAKTKGRVFNRMLLKTKIIILIFRNQRFIGYGFCDREVKIPRTILSLDELSHRVPIDLERYIQQLNGRAASSVNCFGK